MSGRDYREDAALQPQPRRHGADAWDAAEQLHDVLKSGAWRDERFSRRARVT